MPGGVQEGDDDLDGLGQVDGGGQGAVEVGGGGGDQRHQTGDGLPFTVRRPLRSDRDRLAQGVGPQVHDPVPGVPGEAGQLPKGAGSAVAEHGRFVSAGTQGVPEDGGDHRVALSVRLGDASVGSVSGRFG